MAAPPIIIKKKVSHGGRHGGAWKVAYADFVTAMMALFIVLWLTNSSRPVQEAVAGYFRDPLGTALKPGTDQPDANARVTQESLADLKKTLENKIQKMLALDKLSKNVEMTITSEGLRIELLESDKGTFFDSGSPRLKSNGEQLLQLLAAQLANVPNHLSIEGHTDAKPYTSKAGYSNWELSTERANAARRIMDQSGLRPDQVAQVRGFADRRLRNPNQPLEALNRRISIIVQYRAGEGPPETVNAKDIDSSGAKINGAGSGTNQSSASPVESKDEKKK
jgi:chemotaxis protein MotB